MRYAVIMAGGSGTRLWPLSREDNPKQLLPFINGRSLLDIAYSRLNGLIDRERRYVCGGAEYMDKVVAGIAGLGKSQYLYEPAGRDTLNALAYSTAIIAKHDPEAVIAVFTADHVIEPEDDFRRIIDTGFSVIENNPNVLLTFGVTPSHPATGYGYLKLGDSLTGTPAFEEDGGKTAVKIVDQFKEKPELETAKQYINAGPEHYLWNSGMFLWKAKTFLSCVQKYQPVNMTGIQKIVSAYGNSNFDTVLTAEYESLNKISVDYAIMEPASTDPEITVAALPLSISWIDIGSWPAYAEVCKNDEKRNAIQSKKAIIQNCSNTLIVSEDDDHLVALLSVEDLVVVHTENATLVCRKEDAQDIKELRNKVLDKFGKDFV